MCVFRDFFRNGVGRLRACLVVLILNQNYFEFLTEIFKRCDKTNNTQLLGNLLNIFSQGNLRFPEGRRPEGNQYYYAYYLKTLHHVN